MRWSFVLFGFALAACVEPRLPSPPRAPAAGAVEETLVEIPALRLEVVPQLFSVDGKIVGIRAPNGCRLWNADSHEHLGLFTHGCEKLVPAVRETFEMPPGPCDTCVASARNGHQLAVARSEPPGLEIWDLDTKRMTMRAPLTAAPVPNRLVWNREGVHGVYRENRSGGLFIWSPGQTPSLFPLTADEPNFADAVFDPTGTFAITQTDPFQRLAGGAVQCFTLDHPHTPCGTFSETPAADAGPSSIQNSSSWVLAASGPQWWTRTTVTSYSGELTSDGFSAVFIDPLQFAGGPFVAPEQPVVCFRGPKGGECLTEPTNECALADVSATGAFVVRECDDKLRISTREGRVVFERANAKIEAWLSDSKVLVDRTVVDLAHHSETELTRAPVRAVARSANGRVLAVAAGESISMIALPALTPQKSVVVRGGRPSALSNDGALLATKTNEGVEIFEVDTTKHLAHIDAPASSLTFRADGAVVFVVDAQAVRAFDVHSGAERKDAAAGVNPYNLDPFGRVVGEGERTFRRLIDGAILTLDTIGNAETDQGLWDGQFAASRRYRIGEDPFTARFVTTKDLGERVHRKNLARAFFGGEPIVDPRITHEK